MMEQLLKSTKITYLTIIAITIAGLATSEILVSSLHDIKNGKTPNIFTALRDLAFQQQDLQSESPPNTLPAKNFPFRSPFPIERNSETTIWVSSASHGEDLSYLPSEVFPNLVCTHLSNVQDSTCLNHSKAGWTIDDNIKGLEETGSSWNPDFVILYQMSLDIQRMAGKQYSETTKGDAVARAPFSNRIKQYFLSKIENTTLFKDIREFIGSSLLIAAPLPNSLPDEAEAEYLTLLSDFVAQANKLEATPVLTTFAFSHASEEWKTVPYRTKTWIMLWQADISPLGFVKTIENYNESIREFAQEHDVLVVDIEAAIGGIPEYFRDPVHFNKRGHDKVANLIADVVSSVEAESP